MIMIATLQKIIALFAKLLLAQNALFSQLNHALHLETQNLQFSKKDKPKFCVIHKTRMKRSQILASFAESKNLFESQRMIPQFLMGLDEDWRRREDTKRTPFSANSRHINYTWSPRRERPNAVEQRDTHSDRLSLIKGDRG
jgi:hypothetical protein